MHAVTLLQVRSIRKPYQVVIAVGIGVFIPSKKFHLVVIATMMWLPTTSIHCIDGKQIYAGSLLCLRCTHVCWEQVNANCLYNNIRLLGIIYFFIRIIVVGNSTFLHDGVFSFPSPCVCEENFGVSVHWNILKDVSFISAWGKSKHNSVLSLHVSLCPRSQNTLGL